MSEKTENSNMEKEMSELARENFVIWNDAIQTGDPKLVAELYEEDATFLPTLSKDFKKGRSGASEYFEHFLEKNPIGEIVEDEVQVISADSYIHSGMYNFTVGPADSREVAEARFTYVWRRDEDAQWRVSHHHSSLKPT